MNSGSVLLRGLDEKSNKIVEVQLGDDFTATLKLLFSKMYRKDFADIKWWAGVPGVDKAVIWQGTAYQKAERFYLHVSYSDGRLWA